MLSIPTTANSEKNGCQSRRAALVKLSPKNRSQSGIASMKRNRVDCSPVSLSISVIPKTIHPTIPNSIEV